jgi:redox-sensitive bicupin YhaK (pirin superfamily)
MTEAATMRATRTIHKVWRSRPTIEGAGVHLRRAFGYSEVPLFDPFLLFDDFRANKPADYIKGFPWHPHRGIETITYVLGGTVEHGDSMGNQGVIRPGDVQWMTAGSGIIHQEMPQGDEAGRMLGFQLWANLPADHKMMDPRYRGVEATEIPEVVLDDGAALRVICGTVAGTEGPVRDIVTDPVYLDISIPPRTQHLHPTKPDHTAFAYVIEGQGYFCEGRDPFTYEMQGTNYFDMQRDPLLGDGMLVLFEKGDQVLISTDEEPVRFLLMAGRPIGEPVAWYGPIVMNTEEELRIAFEEYRDGTFIKHKQSEARPAV